MASGNKIFDDITRLFGDAAGAAAGVRREIDTMVKGQMEHFLRDLDVATREEVAVLRDQVSDLRRENERLASRVALLEGSPTDSGSAGARRAKGGTKPTWSGSETSPPSDGSPAGNTL